MTTQISLPRETPRYNTSLVPDVDAGRIVRIPRTLVGQSVPAQTCKKNLERDVTFRLPVPTPRLRPHQRRKSSKQGSAAKQLHHQSPPHCHHNPAHSPNADAPPAHQSHHHKIPRKQPPPTHRSRFIRGDAFEGTHHPLLI